MKYLVTGGCGFIGSHLCDALVARGDKVLVLDDLSTGKKANLPAAAQLVVGDVTCAETVNKLMADVDGCFHLAAIASVERSLQAWAETHTVNQTATINVLEAAAGYRKQGRKPPAVVYASSAAVYGDNACMPLSESAQPRPISAYGADKLGSELHARVASIIHGVPTTGLRFFNVYGPRQDPNSPYSGVISIFARRLREGLPLIIHGDGSQSRDFVYVGDVVRFLIAAMEQSCGARVLNVCTGSATSIAQLAQTLSVIAAKPMVLQREAARQGDIQVSLGDPARAERMLGIRSATHLGTGLKAVLDEMDTEQDMVEQRWNRPA